MRFFKNLSIFAGLIIFIFGESIYYTYKKNQPFNYSEEYKNKFEEYKNKGSYGIGDLEGLYTYSTTYKDSFVNANILINDNEFTYEMVLIKENKQTAYKAKATYEIKGSAFVFTDIKGDDIIIPSIGIPFNASNDSLELLISNPTAKFIKQKNI